MGPKGLPAYHIPPPGRPSRPISQPFPTRSLPAWKHSVPRSRAGKWTRRSVEAQAGREPSWRRRLVAAATQYSLRMPAWYRGMRPDDCRLQPPSCRYGDLVRLEGQFMCVSCVYYSAPRRSSHTAPYRHQPRTQCLSCFSSRRNRFAPGHHLTPIGPCLLRTRYNLPDQPHPGGSAGLAIYTTQDFPPLALPSIRFKPSTDRLLHVRCGMVEPVPDATSHRIFLCPTGGQCDRPLPADPT